MDAQGNSKKGNKNNRNLLIGLGVGGCLLICCIIIAVLFSTGVFAKLFAGTSPISDDEQQTTEDLELPHYGVFIEQNGELIKLQEQEIFSTPTEGEINNPQAISDSQPIIIIWRQDVKLDYLELYKLNQYLGQPRNEISYNAIPRNNGGFELNPISALDNGVYCLIQGDPLAALLSGWCFRIGSISQNQLPTTLATDSSYTGKTIKIATQSPLSGGQSLLGTDIKRGAELALEQLSGSLKDMGFEILLAPYDDQATPDVGVANAINIVANPTILCGVGHLNSGVMIPSSEKYHTANLPFVSPANTNPVVTTRGYLEVNRIVGRDDLQAPVAEEYAFTELGAKSVYIIHDKTAYGQGVADLFRNAAQKDNIQILGFEGTEETSNFNTIVKQVLAVNPDVVFFSGIYIQAGVFFKQARDAGYRGTFMGTDGMDSGELATIAGDALRKDGGMVYTSVTGPARAYPDANQFIDDFSAKFGSDPQPFAAQGYDAMGICLKAIENAAMEAGGNTPSRLAVANAIRALTYDGITGTISFNNIGDQPVAKYFIVSVHATSAQTWGENAIVSEIEFAPP